MRLYVDHPWALAANSRNVQQNMALVHHQRSQSLSNELSRMDNPQLKRITSKHHDVKWNTQSHNGKQIRIIKKTTQNNTKGHHRMSPQWLRTPTTQRISCEVKVPSRHGMRFIVTAVVKLLHDSIWTNQKKQIQKLNYTLSDCSENMWKLQIPTGISQKTHKFSGLWSSIWQIACSSWPTWPISKGNWQGWRQNPIES